jgi:hypothetical protein
VNDFRGTGRCCVLKQQSEVARSALATLWRAVSPSAAAPAAAPVAVFGLRSLKLPGVAFGRDGDLADAVIIVVCDERGVSCWVQNNAKRMVERGDCANSF